MTKKKNTHPTFAEHMGFSTSVKKRSAIKKAEPYDSILALGKKLGLIRGVKDVAQPMFEEEATPIPSNTRLPSKTPTNTRIGESTATPSVTPTPEFLGGTITPTDTSFGTIPTSQPQPTFATPGITATPTSAIMNSQLGSQIDTSQFPPRLETGLPYLTPYTVPESFLTANNQILGPTQTAQASITPTPTYAAETVAAKNPNYITYLSQLPAIATQEAADRIVTTTPAPVGSGTPTPTSYRTTLTPTMTPESGFVPPTEDDIGDYRRLERSLNLLMPFIRDPSQLKSDPGLSDVGQIDLGDMRGILTQISALDPNNKASQKLSENFAMALNGEKPQWTSGGYGLNPEKANKLISTALQAQQLAQNVYDTYRDRLEQGKTLQGQVITSNVGNRNLMLDPNYQQSVAMQYDAIQNMNTARRALNTLNNFVARKNTKSYMNPLAATSQARLNAHQTAVTTNTPTKTNTPTSTRTATNTAVPTRTATPYPTQTLIPLPTQQSVIQQQPVQPTVIPRPTDYPTRIPTQMPTQMPTPRPITPYEASMSNTANSLAASALQAGYSGPAAAAAANAQRTPPASAATGGISLSGIGNAIASLFAPQVAAAAAPEPKYNGAAIAAATQNSASNKKSAEQLAKEKAAAEWKAKTEAALRAQEIARANKRSQDQETASNQAASNATNAGYSGAAAAAAAGAYGTGGGGGSTSGGGGSTSGGGGSTGGGGGSSSGGGSQPSFNITNNPVTGLNLPPLKPNKPKPYSGPGVGAKFARMPPSNKKGKLKKDIGTGTGLTAHATQPVKESPMPKITTRYGAYKYPNKNSAFNRTSKYGESQTLQQPIRKQMTPVNSNQTSAMSNPPSYIPNVMQYPPSRAPRRYSPSLPAIEKPMQSSNPPYNSIVPSEFMFKKIMGLESNDMSSINKKTPYVPKYLQRKK